MTQTFAQRTDEPLLMSEQLSSPALALLKSTDCVSHMRALPAGQVGEKQCHLDGFPRDTQPLSVQTHISKPKSCSSPESARRLLHPWLWLPRTSPGEFAGCGRWLAAPLRAGLCAEQAWKFSPLVVTV